MPRARRCDTTRASRAASRLAATAARACARSLRWVSARLTSRVTRPTVSAAVPAVMGTLTCSQPRARLPGSARPGCQGAVPTACSSWPAASWTQAPWICGRACSTATASRMPAASAKLTGACSAKATLRATWCASSVLSRSAWFQAMASMAAMASSADSTEPRPSSAARRTPRRWRRRGRSRPGARLRLIRAPGVPASAPGWRSPAGPGARPPC